MRALIDLVESHKWWDDSDTIRLFHGTSSALLPLIETEGLKPPQKHLLEYTHDILEEYIPRDDWTPALLKRIEHEAARHFGGRAGESGQVIFCMTDMEGPSGYARSLFEHGGEIARDVYHIACDFYMEKSHPGIRHELSYTEYKRVLAAEAPLKPRFHDAQPVVIEMVIPKAWCQFSLDLDRLKATIIRQREEGNPNWQGPLAELLDDVFDNKEVRVSRTVPVDLIKNLHKINY